MKQPAFLSIQPKANVISDESKTMCDDDLCKSPANDGLTVNLTKYFRRTFQNSF